MKYYALCLTLVFTLSGLRKAQAENAQQLNYSEANPQMKDGGLLRSLIQASKKDEKKYSEALQSVATDSAKIPPSHAFDDGAIVTKKKAVVKKVVTRPVRKKVIAKKRKSPRRLNKTEDKISTSQAAVTKSVVKIVEKPNTLSETKFGGALRIDTETDTNDIDNDDKTFGTIFNLSLRYQLNETYTTGAIIIGEKDLSKSYEQKFSGLDSRVFISRVPWELTDNLSLAPSLRLIYPTSNASKVRDEMITGIEYDSRFSYAATDKLSFSYLPRLRRDFHKFETNRENKMNSEYRVLQFLTGSYNILEQLSFSSTLLFSKRWSYTGRQQSDSYLTILNLSYVINSRFSVGAYTLTGGRYENRERGPDQTVELYDPEGTTWGLSTRFAF
ncbi:MAG: hypothetical protein CME62_10115 [Halobacteriovoraceae bacterium]|nr:hypothetical protein [Halobacteriovoraceae bacterium]|tara:strand:+ start:16616 stop:17773 length:1158 start_codon:yes stop_codon:yes gene_type:complete